MIGRVFHVGCCSRGAVRGIELSDDDIEKLVKNSDVGLLTRGIHGTDLHVEDPALRERLRPFFPAADDGGAARQ